MPQESINRIVTIIATHLKRETDEPFKRLLAVKVDYWRSTLIARSLEKHPDQRQFFTQSIWVPMECHSPIPCNVPMTLCNIMRSTTIIPIPLRFGTTLFDYVGSIDGDNPFTYASVGTSTFLQTSKWSGDNTFWEYTNKRIHIRNKKDNYIDKPIPMIRVDGIFDKPFDVMKYNCKIIACDFWNESYPVTGDILQMIIQYILEVDFGKEVNKNISDPPRIEVNPDQPSNE